MANEDYEIRGSGDFAPTAVLTEALDYLSIEAKFEDLVGADDEPLTVGMAVLINEEIAQVTAVFEDRVNIARGCADTIPHRHGVGTRLWFFRDTVGMDWVEYAAGETVSTKVLPNTTSAQYPIELAPPNSIEFNWRFSRPYPPGLMRQNTDHWYEANVLSAIEPSLTLTWAHRDRIIQADRLINHWFPSIGPEPGTTYFARIYHLGSNQPVRTEVGLTGTSWSYPWAQAVADFGLYETPVGQDTPGRIEFGSYRDNLESWQYYTLPFYVNNQGIFMQAAQLSMISVQPPGDGEVNVPASGLLLSQLSQVSAQVAGDDGELNTSEPLIGIFVSQLSNATGQDTSIYTPLPRNLFEAPYTYLLRHEGRDPANARVLTVSARPSDRLTDTQRLYSRLASTDTTPAHPYEYRDSGPFTPWLTIGADIDYLTPEVSVSRTSLFDGIPLTGVLPGQLALVGAELIRVESIADGVFKFARGCVDTTPARHRAGARVWFFESGNMIDRNPWPRPANNNEVIPLNYKTVPDVAGVPLSLDQVPEDRLDLDQRKWRPFPPGRVTVNGNPWYEGAFAEPGEDIIISWEHRNRLSQGVDIVDHFGPEFPPEPGTQYRLSISIRVPPAYPGADARNVLIREHKVDGTRFIYTYDMAYSDGHRAARLLDRCGAISLSMNLSAWRDGLDNWQGYSIMLRLPAPACPPGRNPGGGQAPQWPGRGNGETGTTPDHRPDDPTVADPNDPLNNSGGDNGDGDRPPDEPPPEWPDPLIPPPDIPDIPDGVGRWDYTWDQFWAGRLLDDDPANDGGGTGA